jgi:hypothetical protein
MSYKADGGGGGGFPTAGKEIVVHRDALRDIYKKLQADRDLYDNGGSGDPRDFADHGLVNHSALGNYPASQGLSQSCTQAYNTIKGSYDTFLAQYQALIETIKQTVDNYQRAEDANMQTNRSAGGDSGSGSATTSSATYAG